MTLWVPVNSMILWLHIVRESVGLGMSQALHIGLACFIHATFSLAWALIPRNVQGGYLEGEKEKEQSWCQVLALEIICLPDHTPTIPRWHCEDVLFWAFDGGTQNLQSNEWGAWMAIHTANFLLNPLQLCKGNIRSQYAIETRRLPHIVHNYFYWKVV